MTGDRISRTSLAIVARPTVARLVGEKPMRKAPRGDTSHEADLKWDLSEYIKYDEVLAARRLASPSLAALIGFCWATGGRISEVLAVTPRDLDIQNGMVTMTSLKRTRKDGSGRRTSACRVIPIPGDYLAHTLAVIVADRTPIDSPIWPFTRGHAWRAISGALRAAGVEKGRAKPHALRHGHAVNAVLQGVPLNLIQRQLGHASIVTTAIYLRVTGQDLKAAYSKILW